MHEYLFFLQIFRFYSKIPFISAGKPVNIPCFWMYLCSMKLFCMLNLHCVEDGKYLDWFVTHPHFKNKVHVLVFQETISFLSCRSCFMWQQLAALQSTTSSWSWHEQSCTLWSGFYSTSEYYFYDFLEESCLDIFHILIFMTVKGV